MNNLVVKEYLGNGIEFELVNGCVYANAMMGDYGENDEKTMMELKELNKILMDHKSGKEIKKEILT